MRAGVQRAPLAIPNVTPRTRADPAQPAAVAAPTASFGSTTDSAVRVHRGPEASQLATSLDARAFTRGADVYLPASHGPLTSTTARSLLAHELTHVVQQRKFGAGLPGEATPHGKSLEAEAVAAERSGSLPLAVSQTGSGRPTGDNPQSTSGAQRAPEQPSAESSGDVTTIHLAAGTQRAPTGSVGGQAARDRQPRSDQELEELAQQLYARIGRRLRRELLVDRERDGLVMDLP